MKTCSKCKLSKSLEEFHKSKRLSQGVRSWCKSCERDQHKEWVINNPDKIAEIDRRYNQNNKPKVKEKIKKWKARNPNIVNARRLKRRYGLTMDQYRAILTTQDHCCAICKRHENEIILALHVDHNHITGKVRGMLCSSCNQALGLLKDNPELCRLSAIYLEIDGNNLNKILEIDNEKDSAT